MKFRIEVGGYVTVYRQRTYTIYADSPEEAEVKATDKFVEQQSASGDCDEGIVNSIEEI